MVYYQPAVLQTLLVSEAHHAPRQAARVRVSQLGVELARVGAVGALAGQPRGHGHLATCPPGGRRPAEVHAGEAHVSGLVDAAARLAHRRPPALLVPGALRPRQRGY